MCASKDSELGCVLATRMAKVEIRSTINLVLTLIIGMFLGYIVIKLMNTQIYLLTGERGLHEISQESHSDITVIQKSIKNTGATK
jgi:hypothetical protein